MRLLPFGQARLFTYVLGVAGLVVVIGWLVVGPQSTGTESAVSPPPISLNPAAKTSGAPVVDPDANAIVQLAGEATQAARSAAAAAELRQLSLDMRTGTYDFRFTDVSRELEVIVDGPFAISQEARWRVLTATKDNSNLFDGARAPLDIANLKSGPKRVADAVQLGRAGLALSSLFIVPEDVSKDGTPHWTAFGTLPTGMLRCDLTDSARPLQAVCLAPPVQPPLTARP